MADKKKNKILGILPNYTANLISFNNLMGNKAAAANESLNEEYIPSTSDLIWYEDMISDMFGNMDEDNFDAQLDRFDAYRKILKAKERDVVLLPLNWDSDYHFFPMENTQCEEITVDQQPEGINVFDFDGITIIQENLDGGLTFVWFANEGDAAAYVNGINLDEQVLNEDGEIEYFYGIKPLKVIRHEEGPCELEYNGKTYECYDVEDYLFDVYEDELDGDEFHSEAFKKWVSDNSYLIFDYLHEFDTNTLYEDIQEVVDQGAISANDLGTLNVLLDLLKEQTEMVSYLNSCMAQLNLNNADGLQPTISEILDDEYRHMGMVQELVKTISSSSANIDTGEQIVKDDLH